MLQHKHDVVIVVKTKIVPLVCSEITVTAGPTL